MANGFIQANIFDVNAWHFNEPVKVEVISRQDGDQRPDKFYGLVWDVDKTKLTIANFTEKKERELIIVFIDEVNSQFVEVTMLADPFVP